MPLGSWFFALKASIRPCSSDPARRRAAGSPACLRGVAGDRGDFAVADPFQAHEARVQPGLLGLAQQQAISRW